MGVGRERGGVEGAAACRDTGGMQEILAVVCIACLWGEGAGLRGGYEGGWLRGKQGCASHMSSVGLVACGCLHVHMRPWTCFLCTVVIIERHNCVTWINVRHTLSAHLTQAAHGTAATVVRHPAVKSLL